MAIPVHTHTHTHTHTVHMALMGYFIVFSSDQTLEFLLWGTIVPLNFLAGYYCSIVASTPQPMAYAFTHTVHMALVGYFIVFSFVTKPGQTLEFLFWGTIVPLNFLAGYYCSIVASTPQPTVYASTHVHCTYGTCGVLHCLLFCDQTRPNLRISLVGYHCAIEFPCGVLLFYCCKYPTTYGVRVHTCACVHVHMHVLCTCMKSCIHEIHIIKNDYCHNLCQTVTKCLHEFMTP